MLSRSARHQTRITQAIFLGTLACLGLGGCAGYHVGNATLYQADIQTVYVPMFESASFRRNLAEWLTEAVVKEIELKTPFKVVSTPDADSILTGRITTVNKHVLVENSYGDPRQIEVDLRVEVRWVDRRSNAILRQQSVPLAPDMAQVTSTAPFTPEVGQSVATAQQQAIRRTAEQIVALMEVPW